MRANMGQDYRRHGLAWDPAAFAAHWAAGENLLLWLAGEPVGYLRLHHGEDRCYLQDLQVVVGRRGQGLGSRALERAGALAREKGARALRLRVFADSPAIRFYRRHGFVEVMHDPPLVGMECRTPHKEP
ncbi:hypothetical protein GCM10009016_23020 [Halomonas beimenensis]